MHTILVFVALLAAPLYADVPSGPYRVSAHIPSSVVYPRRNSSRYIR